jgi:hypothetical protein
MSDTTTDTNTKATTTATTRDRRQTLRTAVRHARTEGHPLCRAVNGLVGCPVGGWGETSQAMGRVREELPHRTERRYTVFDLIGRVLEEGPSGRYQRR